MSIIFSFVIVFLMCSFVGCINQYVKIQPIISWQKKNNIKSDRFRYVQLNMAMNGVGAFIISLLTILYVSNLPINVLGYTFVLTLAGMIGAFIFYYKINMNENTKPITVLFDGFTNNCDKVIKNYSRYDSNPVIRDLISKIIDSENDNFFKISTPKEAMKCNELNHAEIEKSKKETNSQCYMYETALIKEIMQKDSNFNMSDSVYSKVR